MLCITSSSFKLNRNKPCALINYLHSIIGRFCFDNSLWWCNGNHFNKTLMTSLDFFSLSKKYHWCQKFLILWMGIYKWNAIFPQLSADYYGYNKMWENGVNLLTLDVCPLHPPIKQTPFSSRRQERLLLPAPKYQSAMGIYWKYRHPWHQNASWWSCWGSVSHVNKNLWSSGRRRANFS